jgi:hypothetical protein
MKANPLAWSCSEGAAKMEHTYNALENHLDEQRKMYSTAVDAIIKKATEASEDGTYEINFDEIPGDLDMLEDRYLIAEMLCERLEIIEVDTYGYGFSLELELTCCENVNVNHDSRLQRYQVIDLIATYEELFDVPTQERLTEYWGDLGGYIKKHGVTDEQLRVVYTEALQAINMSSDAYHDEKFIYRGEVETYMRGCMLARILQPDDEIVFIPPSPTGTDGQWQYEAGTVTEVDADAKNCVVRFEDGEAAIPFRYVLARFRSQAFAGDAFGFEHAEPIFGLPESWAEDFLREVQRAYTEQNPGIAEQDEDEFPGVTMT